jgi:WD40 repeat protein
LDIWDTKCALLKSGIGKHDRVVTGLAILNDRGVAITSSEDGTIIGIDLKNTKLLGSVSITVPKTLLDHGVSALAISDDGLRIAIGLENAIRTFPTTEIISAFQKRTPPKAEA